MIPLVAHALRAAFVVGVELVGEAVRGARRRRAAKRADWLDQPLTPEEIATIRERLREPMQPEAPPRG